MEEKECTGLMGRIGQEQEQEQEFPSCSIFPLTLRTFEGPPGLQVHNSYAALEGEEEEEEVPKMTSENYPEMGSKEKGQVPKPKYTRMPRGGQADRKALSKAFNDAKKEKEKSEKELKEMKDQIEVISRTRECPCAGCHGELQPLIREMNEDGGQELHRLEGTDRWMAKCTETGFTRIRSVLDSGATDSCAPHAMCAEIRSRESEGSRRGQMYTAAGGKRLANEGEKEILMVTPDGEAVTTNWQTVDITRPLSSVRQICMQGNRVVFGASGGVIQNLETGKETAFGIEDNVYVLDLWLPPCQPSAGFPRQS